MTHRQASNWFVWLFPLLLLRALLPTGLMPQSEDGELRLSFCKGVASLLIEGDPDASGDHEAVETDTLCGFGQASATPLAPIASPLKIDVLSPSAPLPPPTIRYLPTGPPRLHTARGPPLTA